MSANDIVAASDDDTGELPLLPPPRMLAWARFAAKFCLVTSSSVTSLVSTDDDFGDVETSVIVTVGGLRIGFASFVACFTDSVVVVVVVVVVGMMVPFSIQ